MSLPRRVFETTLANLRRDAGLPLGAALAVDAVFAIVGIAVYVTDVAPAWVTGFLLLIAAVGILEKTLRRVR